MTPLRQFKKDVERVMYLADKQKWRAEYLLGLCKTVVTVLEHKLGISKSPDVEATENDTDQAGS